MDVVIPTLGESVTEATIGEWLKQVGDSVAEDEPIVSLETDKVAVEVNSPAAGVLTGQKFAAGDTVSVGAVIATVEAGAAAAAKPAPEPQAANTDAVAEQPAAPAAPAPRPAEASAGAPTEPAGASAGGAPADGYRQLSPAVRVLVESYNLDPASITGSGKGGLLTKADVLAAIAAGTAKVQGAASLPAAASAGDAPARSRREERVRMTRLRQTIAKRLKEAQDTAAMLTTFNDVDMSAVMDMRSRYKDQFQTKYGVRLGFMSFFIKACALAARDVPSVNGRIDGDEIVFHDYFDVGVAVSGPGGLVVPILKNAESKSFAEIELEVADFGKRARENKLKIEEIRGGTFTISNGGVFGSLMSTPIINPPQSAVLGMHRIEQRPVGLNGQIVLRPMMYLALSYDHRLIDGREAVTYLVRVKDALEDPGRLIIDL